MEGRRRISGARGRGGLSACFACLHNERHLGRPERIWFATGVSRKHMYFPSCDMSGEKPNEHVGVGSLCRYVCRGLTA